MIPFERYLQEQVQARYVPINFHKDNSLVTVQTLDSRIFRFKPGSGVAKMERGPLWMCFADEKGED